MPEISLLFTRFLHFVYLDLRNPLHHPIPSPGYKRSKTPGVNSLEPIRALTVNLQLTEGLTATDCRRTVLSKTFYPINFQAAPCHHVLQSYLFGQSKAKSIPCHKCRISALPSSTLVKNKPAGIPGHKFRIPGHFQTSAKVSFALYPGEKQLIQFRILNNTSPVKFLSPPGHLAGMLSWSLIAESRWDRKNI